MFPDKQSRFWSAAPVYLACAVVCGVSLGLGILAFRMSGGMVGPASAEAERSTKTSHSVRVSALPADEVGQAGASPSGGRKERMPSDATIAPFVIAKVDAALATVTATEPTAATEARGEDFDEWAGYEPWSPDRSDIYRTVCVRLCDGAYFPMSFSTTRDRFKADAARCKSSCGVASRLFVVKPDGAPEDMVDVRGAGYIDLPNAFKFRTSYDEACRCHSEPWETASIERHRQLAAAAQSLAPVVVPPQPLAVTESVPVMTKRTGSRVEIAALDPTQLPILRASKAEPAAVRARTLSLPAGGAEAVVVRRGGPGSVAAPQGEPQKHVARPTKPVRVAMVPGVAVKPVVVPVPAPVARKPAVEHVRVARVVVSRPTIRVVQHRQVMEASTQRSFRSKDFWRLSYWDVRN